MTKLYILGHLLDTTKGGDDDDMLGETHCIKKLSTYYSNPSAAVMSPSKTIDLTECGYI